MKEFWFKKHLSKKYNFFEKIHTWYIVLVILCYTIFALYHNVTQIVFSKQKHDIFAKNLQEIALYSSIIDRDLAKFVLTLDVVSQSYLSWENVFRTHAWEIEYILAYILKNKHRLSEYGFEKYNSLIDFISSFYPYRKEIYNLFWSQKKVNYLVILQNDSERRPNGGFFGSFALVTMENGFISYLKVIDSYWPNYIAPNAYILAPSWSSSFLQDPKIWFISANKFWFTSLDGKNIKDLYEKIYPEDIKGVIFLRSSFFESLIPWFNEKLWEWQFVNASIDIIRWKQLPNKKEIYIKEINEFFDKNKLKIFQKFVNNFDQIKTQNYINIYLSNVNSGIQNIIEKNHFKTSFKSGFLYSWDANNSFNKIDKFVTKNLQVKNSSWSIIIDTNKDIIDFSLLKKWLYRVRITYTLTLTENYKIFIKNLEKKYNISLWQREQYILGINPIWRSTRSNIYFDRNFTVSNFSGDVFNVIDFSPSFGKWIFYQMTLEKNNTSKSVYFDLSL